MRPHPIYIIMSCFVCQDQNVKIIRELRDEIRRLRDIINRGDLVCYLSTTANTLAFYNNYNTSMHKLVLTCTHQQMSQLRNLFHLFFSIRKKSLQRVACCSLLIYTTRKSRLAKLISSKKRQSSTIYYYLVVSSIYNRSTR